MRPTHSSGDVTIQVLWAKTTQLKYNFLCLCLFKNLNHDCHSKGIFVNFEKVQGPFYKIVLNKAKFQIL